MTALEGIVKDLPDADYRAAEGYGSTTLKWFLEEVPAQAKHWLDHPEDAPTFDSAALGQLIHALILDQPQPFVVKDWSYSTKAGKARAAAALADCGGPQDVADLDAAGFAQAFAAVGISLISADDHKLAKGCAEGVLRHPTIREILERPGSGECSAFAEVEGVRCKARFDWLPDQSDQRVTALDFKSALSAHPHTFTKNAAKFEYAVQRAAYLDVLNTITGPMPFGMEPEMLFVVIDKRRPHLVSWVGISEMWAQLGRDKAAKARRIIRECQESGNWPGYGDGIHYIDAPTWYVFDADDQEIEV